MSHKSNEGRRAGTGLNLEFWWSPRYGDLGILLRTPSRLRKSSRL